MSKEKVLLFNKLLNIVFILTILTGNILLGILIVLAKIDNYMFYYFNKKEND